MHVKIRITTCRLVAALAVMLVCGCANLSAPRAPLTVKLIAFNDFHGHLESPGRLAPSAGDEQVPVGGADALAAHVDRLRAQAAHSVVVGAGDSIGASPLVSSLFLDEPAVEALNRIGLEFNSVGNHEFDKGAAELRRLQGGGCKAGDANSCQGASVGTPVPFEGAKFRWLSANVIEQASGRPLLPAYGIKRFDGIDVAFIGVTLQGTPTIVTPSGVRGLAFRDEAETVNQLVPQLKAQGIEAIVLLLHEGGVQRGPRTDVNGCEGRLAGSPVAGIASRLDDAVDMVISGHTHAAYNCRLPNAAGRNIPVTSAGSFGRLLTDADLTIDPASRDITGVVATNRLVRRDEPGVPPEAAIARIVEGYKSLAARLAGRVIGAIATDLPNTRVDAACNMPAGQLIADAMLAATAAADAGGAQVAFMNGGGVRSPGFVGDGNVTFGEAFTVQPFGNDLVTLTLTAADLRNVLEEQFAGCGGQSRDRTRLMIPSTGFHYTWDGARSCGQRVRAMTLRRGEAIETLVGADGWLVDPSRRYRVTVNNFMAEGGDGYATFPKGSDRRVGPRDVDALADYLSRFKPPAAAYRPEASQRIRRLGGSACPMGADTNP
jgi:5'-nucleotidase